MGTPLVHLTWDSVAFEEDSPEVGRARLEFRERHMVLLPNLLAPDVLEFALAEIERESFAHNEESTLGPDFRLINARVARLLFFLANRPDMYRAVRRITGCESVRGFVGRVARIPPGCGLGYKWHDDVKDRRLIGMTLNLNDRPYLGGALHLRDRDSERILSELSYLAPGDAVLFRIRLGIQHQVTPVEGDVPRTSLTGWYTAASTCWPEQVWGASASRSELSDLPADFSPGDCDAAPRTESAAR